MSVLLPRVKGFTKRVLQGAAYAEHPVRYLRDALSRRDRKATLGAEFRVRGVRFHTRPADWCAFEEILVEGEYEVVGRMLGEKANPVVVDLGANVGLFAVSVFADRPAAVVHSYEPSAATFAVLAANQAKNPELQWTVHRAAVHEADGEISFWNAPASTGSRVAPVGEAGNETVPAVGLERVLRQHVGAPVDLMKVDIEGAEEAVLCGNETLLGSVHSLLVEIHPDRCDGARVRRTIELCFPHVWEVGGRASSKPLIAATRGR